MDNCTKCNQVLSDTYKLDTTCEQRLMFTLFYTNRKCAYDIHQEIKHNINKVLHIDQTSHKDMRKAIFSLLVSGEEEEEEEDSGREPFTEDFFDNLLSETNSLNCMQLCKGNNIKYDTDSILCIPLFVETTVFHNTWEGQVLVLGVVGFRCHKSIDTAPTISISGNTKLTLHYKKEHDDDNDREPLSSVLKSAEMLRFNNCNEPIIISYIYSLYSESMKCDDTLSIPADISVNTYTTQPNSDDYCREQTRRVLDYIKIRFAIHIQEIHHHFASYSISERLKKIMFTRPYIELNESLMDELRYSIPTHLKLNNTIPSVMIEELYNKILPGRIMEVSHL